MSSRAKRGICTWEGLVCFAGAALAACGSDAAPRQAIALDQVATIRESGDSVLFDGQTRLFPVPGGFVISRVQGARALAFYDSTGKLKQLEGTKGKGPGEYAEVSATAVGPGDSLYVGDMANGRISILSPGDHKFARAFPAERHEAVFHGSPDGRLMGAVMTASRQQGRREFGARRVSWDGKTLTSIGGPGPMGHISRLTPAAAGRVWATEGRTYKISLFDGDNRIRSITQTREWFPPDTTVSMTFSKPFIGALGVEGDSLLWVFIRRPNPAWKTGQPMTRPLTPGQLPPLGDVFVGTLEVLHAVTGKLIASTDVPGDIMAFIGPGRMYQLTDDGSGALEFRVWQARLKPPN